MEHNSDNPVKPERALSNKNFLSGASVRGVSVVSDVAVLPLLTSHAGLL